MQLVPERRGESEVDIKNDDGEIIVEKGRRLLLAISTKSKLEPARNGSSA